MHEDETAFHLSVLTFMTTVIAHAWCFLYDLMTLQQKAKLKNTGHLKYCLHELDFKSPLDTHRWIGIK